MHRSWRNCLACEKQPLCYDALNRPPEKCMSGLYHFFVLSPKIGLWHAYRAYWPGDLGDARCFSYLCVMFIRRKYNRSGTISVVVVDKSGGRFKEIHRVGIARTDEEASTLEAEGRHWIATYGGQRLIDFEGLDSILKCNALKHDRITLLS